MCQFIKKLRQNDQQRKFKEHTYSSGRIETLDYIFILHLQSSICKLGCADLPKVPHHAICYLPQSHDQDTLLTLLFSHF